MVTTATCDPHEAAQPHSRSGFADASKKPHENIRPSKQNRIAAAAGEGCTFATAEVSIFCIPQVERKRWCPLSFFLLPYARVPTIPSGRGEPVSSNSKKTFLLCVCTMSSPSISGTLLAIAGLSVRR